jgi:hypothetical protein
MFKGDYLSGDLGSVKTSYKNPRSKYLATPTTWERADPDYLIEGLVWGEDMELVTCTLNGRMWMFKSADEGGYDLYSVVVLAENPETKRLEMVAANNLPRTLNEQQFAD